MTVDSMPAALLWDLDGTIVDSEPVWATATKGLLDSYGVTLPREVQRSLIGMNLWGSAKILQDHGVEMPIDEIVYTKADRVAELYSEMRVDRRPGAAELLAAAVAHSIPNALVTMSLRHVAAAAVATFPADTFAFLQGGDDVTHPKPHPEPYLLAAQRLGVNITDCVAFEDSPTGLASASASGAVTVGVRHVIDLSECDAHVVLDTLAGVTLSQITEIATRFRGVAPRPGGYPL